jgi:hypothetical protein
MQCPLLRRPALGLHHAPLPMDVEHGLMINWASLPDVRLVCKSHSVAARAAGGCGRSRLQAGVPTVVATGGVALLATTPATQPFQEAQPEPNRVAFSRDRSKDDSSSAGAWLPPRRTSSTGILMNSSVRAAHSRAPFRLQMITPRVYLQIRDRDRQRESPPYLLDRPPCPRRSPLECGNPGYRVRRETGRYSP